MRRLVQAATVAALLLVVGDLGAVSVPNLTGASHVGLRNRIIRMAAALVSADLSTTRSFTIEQLNNNGDYGLLDLYISVTDANNSVTALGLSCGASFDDSSTSYTIQSCSTASGVCTSSDASWTKDPSAITSPKRWLWRVDIEGIEDVTCTFTNTGGTGADTLLVTGAVAVKG